MRILLWHVHGSWTTSFVQGPHDYLVPVLPDRGPDGRGRAQTWEWPSSVVEMSPQELRSTDFDVVILQRPEELSLAERWLPGRRIGSDFAAVYLEHNAPQGRINEMDHPAKDRSDMTVVHVTHFNRLFWDSGSTRSTVIEHGILDPGYRYSGELQRVAVAINEPVRRARVTGTDLLDRFGRVAPLDLFGMGVSELGGVENLPQARLHDEMARRRAYLHPIRWTSLGLSLLEAMHLGMPVVALATTEAPEAVPPDAGKVSNKIEVLEGAIRRLMNEPEHAREMGRAAREAALSRYGLKRFLDEWDELLMGVID